MESVLAGSFYPSDPNELKNQIVSYIAEVELDKNYENPLGIISPHAGYVYSGKCAAYGFKALKKKNFKLAVIIAPCHRYIGFEYSVGNFEAYRTPLGLAKIDEVEVSKLLSNEKFQFLPKAYQNENSLETQIPFIQLIKPDAQILPILIGNQCKDNSRYLARTLYKRFKDRLSEVVFIASSDLSHYHESKIATEMDGRIAKSIKSGNINALLENIDNRDSEACGYGPIMTLLYLSEFSGYDQIENLNYTHSGEISGDNNQVVGYLSSIICTK